ncbi:AraC family transcriptional regulator [Mucilaginibacter sp. RS28]|uniref:AraC family transcriptional regulator n=1 Tax=Mucilaginibacter straminoryzae TaxID=2932774 RepID=A0A9X1X5P6_9SPHI|nr:AraC family transcriptional regulator [Mucilaginibacter straminoryzae]MCJ8210550.1 AraC family transcriptional regulator [Mucilaginibacter straminoryzae]
MTLIPLLQEDAEARSLKLQIADRLNYFSDEALPEYFQVHFFSGYLNDFIELKSDCFTLIFCQRGTVRRTVGNIAFTAEANTLHMTAPDAVNQIGSGGEQIEVFVIFFKKDFLLNSNIHDEFLEGFLNDFPAQPPITTITPANVKAVTHLLQRINEEFKNRSPFHDQLLRLMFMEVVYLATRSYFQQNQQQQLNRASALASRFYQLVDEHFLSVRNVQEYADKLYVSSKYLIKVIKQETGLTPLQYIHNRVLKEAEALLTHSDMSIKEITDKLNFDSSSHFSRFIKHATGYNPSDFQRQRAMEVLPAVKA